MGFSIIIPVQAITDYIHESIPITLDLDYSDFEILILPNEAPTEALPDYLRHERVRIIPTGRVSPALKRDEGAKLARFQYLAFLDADAYPAADWLQRAEALFKEKAVAALGGPGMTPPNAPWFEGVSGLFFESIVGGGGMDYRYKPGPRGFFVEDFPTVNLIVEKEAFWSVGGFDNAFWPGEDTKFCLDFTKAGHKIWYDPTLLVYHHRRPTLRGHLRQVGNYGKHRGYFAKHFPETSARLTYFVPTGFFLGNMGLALLALGLDLRFGALLMVLLAIYFVLGALDMGRRRAELKLVLAGLGTMYCSHMYCGWMFLRGLLSRGALKSQLR